MKATIFLIIILLMNAALHAQILADPNPNAAGVKYRYVAGKKGVLVGVTDGRPNTTPDSAALKEKLAIKVWDSTFHRGYTYDPSLNDWVMDGTGGSDSTILDGGPTTSVPPAGFNPGSNITVAEFIQKAFYDPPVPTASLSGGQQIELMSSGAALPFTLNWTAGRQSATNPIQSIVVAGVSQTFTPPPAGGTVSGTQAVNVVRNANITFSNIVTTTDSKTTTTTTTFTFLPKRYFGWVNSTNPTDASIIAAGGELSASNAKSWTQQPPSGSQFLMFAYPASEGNLSRFDINTFPSLGAMQLIQRNLTNASGFTSLYNIYVSTNAFTVTSTTSIVTN